MAFSTRDTADSRPKISISSRHRGVAANARGCKSAPSWFRRTSETGGTTISLPVRSQTPWPAEWLRQQNKSTTLNTSHEVVRRRVSRPLRPSGGTDRDTAVHENRRHSAPSSILENLKPGARVQVSGILPGAARHSLAPENHLRARDRLPAGTAFCHSQSAPSPSLRSDHRHNRALPAVRTEAVRLRRESSRLCSSQRRQAPPSGLRRSR